MSQKIRFAKFMDVPKGHKVEGYVDNVPFTSSTRKGDKATLYWEWLSPEQKRPISKQALMKRMGYTPDTPEKAPEKAPAPVPVRNVKGLGLATQYIGDMRVGATREFSRGILRLVNRAMHGRGGSFTLVESGEDADGYVTRLYVRRETAKVQDGASFLVCTQGRYVTRKA